MRSYPGYSQDGDTAQRLAGVEYFSTANLGGNVVLAVAETLDRPTFIKPGFNSFMFISQTVTGATITLQYVHRDPETDAVVFVRTIASYVVAATPQLAVWGAFAGVAGTESWLAWNLRFVNTSGAVPASITSPRLWISAR